MKSGLFVLTLLLAALPFASLFAQIGVTLDFQKREFLRYEPVIAKVTLRNDSGQTIVFGSGEDFRGDLKFEILDRSKRILPLIDPGVRMVDGIVMRPGESQDVFVYLNRFYDLSSPNRYDIKCVVSHTSQAKSYESNPKYLEVSPGVTEWKRTVGVPGFMLEADKPSQDRLRSFTVLSLQNNGRKNLYVAVEDDHFVYSVRSICTIMGNENFSAEIDNLSRLHLLIPIMPKEFKYIVIAMSGDVDRESIYNSTNTIPVLARDPQSGRVYVVGGEEAQKDDDLKI
ncbi:MAG: hypothetical protein PHI85_03640 [Victivallaceae bacterium]|nr:hypothetical protein [Victivallaceae bacterium]